MSLEALLEALEGSPVGMAISQSSWAFPTIETVHVIALTLVVGSIGMMDLRLLGLAGKKHAVTRLASDVLPWTWSAFVVAAIFGSLLFTSAATSYWANPFFRTKMVLMMLAGLQTLPEDVYEAAELENASAWQQFWGITFPMLLPISAAVVFIRLIESYKIMDTVFVMTGGGPGVDTETLTLFAYQEGFKKFNLGYTSALSFLFLIAITIIGVTYLALLRPHLEKRR